MPGVSPVPEDEREEDQGLGAGTFEDPVPRVSLADRQPVALSGGTRMSIRLLAIMAVCVALYYGKSLFLPLAFAVVLALVISPIIKFGQRLKIPAVVSATLIMLTVACLLVGSAMTLATPFSNLVASAPSVASELKFKLRDVVRPMEEIDRIEENVDELAGDGSQKPQQVVVKQPGLVARAADNVASIAASVLLTLVLAFFLAISRDMFFRKVVRVLPRLSDKKKALAAATDVERDVSRYLLTVTVINSCLGLAVGISFWVLDMPNALLWGVLAALLNFLPYIGALIGILASACVAIITFPTLAAALAVPGVYVLITALEGQFITPTILGRRFSLNTVVILIAISFWGFIWGAAGVIIAVPMLIILKVLCERVAGLAALGEFISGDETPLETGANGSSGLPSGAVAKPR
ncbi:MAG: AI-2E family transporter [Pseudomonadota bacterium]